MPPSTIAGSLNYWLWRSIGRLALNRIKITGKEFLQADGPVLFVATHRNGALDVAPYALAAPFAAGTIYIPRSAGDVKNRRNNYGRCYRRPSRFGLNNVVGLSGNEPPKNLTARRRNLLAQTSANPKINAYIVPE